MGQTDRDISTGKLQIVSVSESERIHSCSASWLVGSQNSPMLQRK